MRILYVFPEPLPLPRARGIQVAHTVAALAQQGVTVHLAYVPSGDGADPLAAYGIGAPHVGALVEKARQASSMKGNPIVLTAEELERILTRAIS